jgi:hypothetical protein
MEMLVNKIYRLIFYASRTRCELRVVNRQKNALMISVADRK